MQIAVTLMGLVAIATALGLIWRASQGRVRRSDRRGEQIADVELGRDATLLQLSSEVCAPCRATAKVLGGLVSDGVRHVEIDIADRPELAARFNVLQTPTTLILDAHGSVRARISGAVRRDVVAAELARVVSGKSSHLAETGVAA